MKQNRRDFLTAVSCLGAVSMLGKSHAAEGREDGLKSMLGFAASPLDKVRIAVAPSFADNPIGHLSSLPGVEITALCAENSEDIKWSKSLFERRKLPPPKEYVGVDACKRMVDDRVADVFYDSLPCLNNTDINVYAMNGKMHVISLPPVRCTVDDCWKLVEASEKNGVHCVSSGNRCYDSDALFALNVVRRGLLGNIVACEGAYFRDMREMFLHIKDARMSARWESRLVLKGMPCPWNGPFAGLFRCLDINHGDRLETIVSMSAANSSLKAFSNAQSAFPVGVETGGCDMSAALVRTAKGRLVTLRQALALSCPYYTPAALYGTKGVLFHMNAGGMKMACDSIPGGKRTKSFFDDKIMTGMQEKLRHPLANAGRELGPKLGIHWGQKQTEDMYRIYCLRYGLPLGSDVYDFAMMASLVELTDMSARACGKPMEFPDFTRGAWKLASPTPIEEVDMEKVLKT